MSPLVLLLVMIPPFLLGLRRPKIPLTAKTFAICLYLAFGGTLVAKTLGFSLAQAAGGALGVVLLVNTIAERRRLPGFHLVDVLQFLLVLLLLFRLLFVPEAPTAAAQASSVLLVLIGLKGLPRLDVDAQLRALDAIAMGGFVVACACYVQYFMSPTLFGLLELPPSYELGLIKRVTGLYGNPNAAAFYLCIGFAALLVRMRSLRDPWRLPAYGGLAVIGVAALMTQSRAGFAVLVLAALAQVIRAMRRSGHGALVAILAVTAAAGVLIVQGQQVAVRLFPDRQGSLVADAEREGRLDQALTIMRERPFAGDPLASYDGARANYHNDVIQLAADHGVFVGMLFAVILAVLVLRLRRYARDTGEPLMEAALYIAVCGVTIAMSHNIIASGFLFWLTVGAALVQAQHGAEQRTAVARPRTTLRTRAAVV